MPNSFVECQKTGGRIRTITGPNKDFKLEEGEYRPVCIKGTREKAKFYWGEKHKKKEK